MPLPPLGRRSLPVRVASAGATCPHARSDRGRRRRPCICCSTESWLVSPRKRAERVGRAGRYWTLAEAEPRAWQVPPAALSSDARERADLVALARGDLKAAQVLARPLR